MRTLAVIVMACLLVAGAAGVAQVREGQRPLTAPADDAIYLTSGTTVRRLAAGYTALAADLYWIRAVQYFGGERLRMFDPAAGAGGTPPSDGYAQLYPLLNLTTTLDPRFNIAYRFGALFLAETSPGGPGRPDLAIALLEKGLAAQPDKWEYMQDIGFVHYWWRGDFKAASDWFERASRVQGAPWFLKSLAATTVAAGGDRQSSRLMWQSIRESAELDWLKNDAERHLLQLDATDALEQLQAVIDRAALQIPGLEASWTSLIRAGVLRGVPLDPAGTPFDIDASGKVSVSKQSPLYPLQPEPFRRAS